MPRSVLILAIIAAIILVLAQFASAQASPAKGTVVAPPSTQGTLGIPVRTNLYTFIPEGGSHTDIPAGETPASIACIYGVTKRTLGCHKSGRVVPTGGKNAIAVVEYGSNSTMQSDLNAFSKKFGLATPDVTEICAVGTCPSNDGTGWDLETALDVQWTHAMAPKAKLYVVEFANDPVLDGAETDAATAVAEAGGGEVSNSWVYSQGEWPSENQYDKYFVYSGVVFFAASGDWGGVTWYPSVSPNVVSAGGTTIIRDRTGNYQTQHAWPYGGGGLAFYEDRPSYQNVIKKILGIYRGTPDVSADADPASGVAVYTSTYCGGWCVGGGTSVATPVLAGITNESGDFLTSTNAENTKIYKEYANKRQYKKLFLDITWGNNGYGCHKGWDYCSGVGAPLTRTGE